jgi:hypothetical protein
MGTLSSYPSRRLRAGRNRRRVFYFAEVLETRQLLSVASVASVHAIAAPLINVPAIIGPVIPSPVTTSPTASTTSTTQLVEVVFVVNQAGSNAGSGNGGSPGFLVFEESFSGGIFSGAGNPTSTTSAASNPTAGASAGSAAATQTSITPLTATILAGPSGVNRAPIIVVVPQQPLVVNLGPSTISVTTQAILLTATQEEQPLAPAVLGQGFESPVGQGIEIQPDTNIQGQTVPARIELQRPATDYIEPSQPAPENSAPAQPVEPPAAETARRVTEPVEAILTEPIALTDWGKQPDLPLLTPRIELSANEEYPTWSLATMVGTAAVASGGYQLLMGGSDRLNQRWIPTRRSSRRSGPQRPDGSE